MVLGIIFIYYSFLCAHFKFSVLKPSPYATETQNVYFFSASLKHDDENRYDVYKILITVGVRNLFTRAHSLHTATVLCRRLYSFSGKVWYRVRTFLRQRVFNGVCKQPPSVAHRKRAQTHRPGKRVKFCLHSHGTP